MRVEGKAAIKDTVKTVLPLIILVMILCVGAYLRFVGLNWDENSHPHPDERFLTMVETALRIPSSIANISIPRNLLSIRIMLATPSLSMAPFPFSSSGFSPSGLG